MTTIPWDDKYKIGVVVVDEQHRGLFDLMEKIIEAAKVGDIPAVSKYIGDLKQYTIVHFGEEEAMFSATAYPDVEMHKQKHKFFVQRIAQFEAGFNSKNLTSVYDLVSGQIVSFLSEWLLQHIGTIDPTYVPYLKNKK